MKGLWVFFFFFLVPFAGEGLPQRGGPAILSYSNGGHRGGGEHSGEDSQKAEQHQPAVLAAGVPEEAT